MERDFNHAKNIVDYLERRYSNLKNHKISDDIVIVNSICNDHTLEQINMMRKRINASISHTRDTSYLNNNSVNFLSVYLTIVCTFILGFITIGIQLVLAYIEHVVGINEKLITLEDLNKILDSLDLSKIMNIAIFLIIVLSIIIYLSIHRLSTNKKRESIKLYMYDVLVKEAYDKKEKMETQDEEVFLTKQQ